MYSNNIKLCIINIKEKLLKSRGGCHDNIIALACENYVGDTGRTNYISGSHAHVITARYEDVTRPFFPRIKIFFAAIIAVIYA